jgi:hypothetical protein
MTSLEIPISQICLRFILSGMAMFLPIFFLQLAAISHGLGETFGFYSVSTSSPTSQKQEGDKGIAGHSQWFCILWSDELRPLQPSNRGRPSGNRFTHNVWWHYVCIRGNWISCERCTRRVDIWIFLRTVWVFIFASTFQVTH